MTILEYLTAQTGYPVPQATLEGICIKRNLTGSEQFTAETDAIKLAKADMWWWLVQAPSVSQGGISFTLTDTEKATYRSWAKAIYNELGETGSIIGSNYGYQGSRL